MNLLDESLAAWLDRLAEPWHRLATGCRGNQTTADLIVPRGPTLDDIHVGSWRGVPLVVRPRIAGQAQIGTNNG